MSNGKPKRQPETPVCPYCGEDAEFLESSAVLYGGQNYGPAWRCAPCSAWVGCHKGTNRPLGRLANAELRKAKRAAHDAFDALWRGKMRRHRGTQKQARAAASAWLAEQIKIEAKDCRIGMMDVVDCRRVVDVCSNLPKRTAKEA